MLNQKIQTQTKQNNDPTDQEILLSIIERQDRLGLHMWIQRYFGLDIPQQKICKDHCAPFDFVADYIFGLYDFMVVVANRSGGKTMNFGMLDTIMSWTQEKTEIATVGAIQFQAQKAYEYFNSFSSKQPFTRNILRPTMKQTTCVNGSEVKILTGTMSGVNSPHPQLVFLDEIDLMVWQVLQQALSMAQSKGDVRARTVLTSTRKFAGGPMQRLLDEAESKKAKVYMWCIWDVIEPLPTGNPALMKEIYDTFGALLPKNINSANGYYTWRDALTKYNILDNETWETEWTCARPGLEGVIYGTAYDDDRNLIPNYEGKAWSPVGKDGYYYLAEDFGYGEGHPDATLFCFIPREFDRIIIFDEIYQTGQGDDAIWQSIDDKLKGYGLHLPDQQKGVKSSITGWAPDYHNSTAIEYRQRRNAPMLPKHKDAQRYVVVNGIGLVRKLLESGRLMITPNCKDLRTEFLSYKKKKGLDGNYSKDPEKKNDHGMDAIRYLITILYDSIFDNAFAPKIKQIDVTANQPKSERFGAPPNPYPLNYEDPDRSITAGFLSGEEVF